MDEGVGGCTYTNKFAVPAPLGPQFLEWEGKGLSTESETSSGEGEVLVRTTPISSRVNIPDLVPKIAMSFIATTGAGDGDIQDLSLL